MESLSCERGSRIFSILLPPSSGRCSAEVPKGCFFFSLSHQEGLHSYRPSCFCGRVGLPDINNFAAPPAAGSGDLLPSVYTPWDGNQPEPHAHIERRGERGGWGKSGPRAPYCGPKVLGNGSGKKSSNNGGDRPGSFRGSKRRPMWSSILRMTGAWVMKSTTRIRSPQRHRRGSTS